VLHRTDQNLSFLSSRSSLVNQWQKEQVEHAHVSNSAVFSSPGLLQQITDYGLIIPAETL
jgi:hypothetical protein